MTAERAYNETKLIAELKSGDTDAFTQIFKQYSDQVFTFAFALTKSRETAEDLMQEVFSKLWERRDQIDTLQSFQGYVKKITYNHVISFFRKAKLDKSLQRELYLNSKLLQLEQHTAIADKELAALYQNTVDQLPAQRKKAYLMSRDGGLSYEDIAEEMGISKNTVRNHISEALHFIRQQISHKYMAVFVIGAFLIGWLKIK